MATELAPAPKPSAAPADAVSSWMTGNAEAEATLPVNVKPPEQPAPAGTQAPPPSPSKPAAPVEAKPAEAAPAAKPEAEEGDEKWPRTSEDWKKFKAARKEKENELSTKLTAKEKEYAALQDKLAKLGDIDETLSLKDKLAQTEKAAAEYEQLLRVKDVENHPRFKAYFDGKINPRVEMAKKIVGADNAELMGELLAMPDSRYRDAQIREIVSGLDVYDQSRIGGIINELDQIQGERTAEIAKAKENYSEMTKTEQAAAQAKLETNKKLLEKTFNDRLTRVTDPKEGLFIFQKQEGNEEWNKAVDARLAAAKSLMFGDNTPVERIAEAALFSVAMPDVLQWAVTNDKTKSETIAKLEAQVKALSASNPGALPAGQPERGSDGPAPSRAPVTGGRPMDVLPDWMKTIRQDWQPS